MLPVGGVIARFVAAGFVAFLPNPVQLASTLPPGELASIGAMPILTVAVFFCGAWLTVRTFSRPGALRDFVSDRRILLAGALVMGVGIVTVEAPWVGVGSAITSYVLFLIACWLGIREGLADAGSRGGTQPVRGGRLAFALALMYGLASVAYGFGGRLGPSGTVVSTAIDVPAGSYIRAGEDADWLFLAPCSSRGVVLQVPKSAVTSIRWESPAMGPAAAGSDVYRVCP
jgi:hypothetical protein